MTGNEHYCTAERLLEKAAEAPRPAPVADINALHERALVHATLAVAAMHGADIPRQGDSRSER